MKEIYGLQTGKTVRANGTPNGQNGKEKTADRIDFL